MADLLIHTGRFNADTQQPIMERWHDNGDGTYSQVVDIGASVTLSGALTVADGADVTQGAKADALATDTTSPWSVLALLKGLLSVLGFSGDATVAAGAVGSLSAKLRRVTQGIEDLKTLIIAGGKYNATPPTLTDAQRGDLQLDSAGNLKVRQQATTASYGAATIGISAGLIKAANASRYAITVVNNGTVPIFIGSDNTVTTSTGLPVYVQQSVVIATTTDLYGISTLAGQDVRYFAETA